MGEVKTKMPEEISHLIKTVEHMAENTVGFNESDNVHEFRKGMSVFANILAPILRERFEKTYKTIEAQEKELAKWRI